MTEIQELIEGKTISELEKELDYQTVCMGEYPGGTICSEIQHAINKAMTEVRKRYLELSLQDSGYFECQQPILSETEKAICFDTSRSWLSDQHKGVWIPKSQMIILDMGMDSGVRYFVKNWLYKSL